MLVILSPAKKQTFVENENKAKTTLPCFLNQTKELVETLRTYDNNKIAKLMSISNDLAELNVDRFKSFDPSFSTDCITSPAILAFQGDAYRSLQASDFDSEDIKFCQQNLAIISGLYGLLNPYDLIQAYRLEMKTKIPTAKGKNLYEFWGDEITKEILNKLASHTNKSIINLASDEYAKAINVNKLESPFIKVDFKEEKNNKLQTIGIHAKKARGAMARYIIKNKLTQPKDILTFDTIGYKYEKSLSDDNEFVFVR
jgi:cytoplasmic iron level regulating protein YaaA (DUF328/UPF0246 family)